MTFLCVLRVGLAGAHSVAFFNTLPVSLHLNATTVLRCALCCIVVFVTFESRTPPTIGE